MKCTSRQSVQVTQRISWCFCSRSQTFWFWVGNYVQFMRFHALEHFLN